MTRPTTLSGPTGVVPQRHALLAMLSSTVEPDCATLATFTDEDWQAISTMAHQHRLKPLLHTKIRQRGAFWSVPQELRNHLKVWHLQATARAMICHQALRRTAALLAAADVPFAVLKGGWLAWGAYPDPAQRVLRDIDLLVAEDHAAAAFAALEAAGFTRRARDVTPIDHALLHAKHLPGLICPDSGILVELHTRIIHDLPGGDLTGTIGDNAALLARSVPHDLGGFTVPCLSPTDTLLHLIVHAAHDHQFDNGPLVLNDIAMLVQGCAIDWDLLRSMAAAGQWQRGSAMLLRLTWHYHGPFPVPEDLLEPAPQDQALLEAAAQLMLVDRRSSVDTHFRAGLLGGTTLRERLDFVRQRALPKRHALAAFAGLPLESPRVWLHYPLWLLNRSRQRLLAQGGPGQEQDRRNLQTVSEWLRA